MSTPTDRGIRPTLGAAGISFIILLAAFGIYYFVYAERQTAYFSHRDLRILGTVARQLEDSDKTRFTPDVLFAQSVLRVFDSVMLADAAGTITQRSGEERIATLDKLQTTGTWEKPKDIDLKQLQLRADHRRIVLHGDTYHLFTQPLKLDGKPFVLAGLVSGTHFNRESLTISYTLILCVLAALLLTVFSMPFLKLKLIGSLHRVRLSDVLVLGVCLMCAVSVLTIALLDMVTYLRLRSECDTQLRHLAGDINAHVHREIDGALGVLIHLDRSIAPKPGAKAAIDAKVLNADAIRTYPWFQSMFRIDQSGHLVERWSAPREMKKDRGIGIDVNDRDYFNDLKFGREWNDSARGKYTLNSLHSLSTGETQAVIARHPEQGAPNIAAVGLGIPMMSLIKPVVAGDCRYVVVDNEGQVLFHSEPQRNLAENFFDETDHDRALRAAVAGRQNELLDIRYWGDDQRAFVAPIPNTPWTLITFRSKVLLRTLNVEMIMITAVFMLIYALGCAMTLLTIALLRPRYRAPWLWPDPARAHDYRRLIGAFCCVGLAFLVSIYSIRPRELMILALALPLIALVIMFLRLHGVRGVFSIAAGALLGALVVVWIAVTVSSDGIMEPDLFWNPTLLRLVILLSGTTGIVIALPPLTAKERAKTLSTPHYVGLGAMLTVMLAILPTMAFFKAAYKIELESFVKYGQLRIARLLEQRTNDIAAAGVNSGIREPLTNRIGESLDLYYDFFFATDVRSIVKPLAASAECAHRFKQGAAGTLRAAVEASVLPGFLEPLLPQYSDDSVAMRELHHDSSRDNQWQWSRCGADLDLHVNSVYGPQTFVVSRLPHQGLHLAMFDATRASLPYAPMFKPEAHREDPSVEPELMTQTFGGVMLLFVVVMYVAVIYTMIRFMLHYVFLVDVRKPETLAPDEQICGTFGGNLMILARDRESALRSVKRDDFIEVQLADLQSHPHESWAKIMTRIDQEPPERGVLITDFDAPATSADFGKAKLHFLERLMNHHGRSVFAITLTSPWVVLDEACGDTAAYERWQAVLQRFELHIDERRRKPRPQSTVTLGEALIPAVKRLWNDVRRRKLDDAFNGSSGQAEALILRETGHDEFLQKLGAYLRERNVRGQEEIYDELGDRAAAYYASIWTSCSRQEKVVLLNVATDGFVNAKDRALLRRLMARELVTRGPDFSVMNETFRRFVCKQDRRELAAGLEDERDGNAWDNLQKPLAIGVACFAIFFFSTQREMFDVTMGVVTGLAGGIPAFLRVMGMFLDPQSAVKAASGR